MLSYIHSWNVSPRDAVKLQTELAGQVLLQPLPDRFDVLGAADIGYVAAREMLAAALLTFSWPSLEPLETATVIAPIRFPYIPGLLSFREVPPLLEAFAQLNHPPDVLLCDGQGIAHPRKLGLASHLGLILGIPTVGCAKKRLCGTHEPFEWTRGNAVPLVLHEETVGLVYCSRTGVKPIYLSPGHLADLDSSRRLIERCLSRFRLPEPLRRAHATATRLRQEIAAGKPVPPLS